MVDITIGDKKPGEEKKGGLFSKKPDHAEDFSNITAQVSNSIRRLRVLEERYLNLRRKTQVIEQNMISGDKKLNMEIKTINSDVMEIKSDIIKLKEMISELVSELGNFAQKEDVVVLQKYINMWEPLNFVTRKEVQQIVTETIEKILEK